MKNSLNITLSLPKQTIELLRKEKENTGLAYSDIVRRALTLYFRGKLNG